MGLFKKDHDPLEEELQRLAREQEALEQEAKNLEENLKNPTPPQPPQEQESIFQGATFKPDPESLPPSELNFKNRQLRVQQKIARNRFFVLFGIFIILLVILIRVLFSNL